MIITHQNEFGHVYSCKSEDGLVIAKGCPTTVLYGEFYLVEAATGRDICRREYLDYNRPAGTGYLTGEKVPEDVWASAVRLMHEWCDHQRKREDDARDRGYAFAAACQSPVAEMVAAKMDSAASDH